MIKPRAETSPYALVRPPLYKVPANGFLTRGEDIVPVPRVAT